MIKLPKIVAFIIFLMMTLLLANSFSNFDWNIFKGENDPESIFKELREPLMFLLLTIFFLNYYVETLKEKKKPE
ncbi:hypothetical protein [Psychroflexus tropicus]|uniref:hypothetical protein n=1 Tax=Psychroflexus tropicus TaxID=197345 RepID=UPI000360770D|nr:hypothetical protein [Psychroflexus tropicus]